ncbi:hypothetical protein L6164_009321 [Bauhinia variegata]|uniref:Uncharacterized protein n=1 Tax=Bauhinia variegata TaxID=167791 RepID=A0ACB9PM99_BAUVA|nr:hypothetical protein L6164_009321 [Bauhinia variegata]
MSNLGQTVSLFLLFLSSDEISLDGGYRAKYTDMSGPVRRASRQDTEEVSHRQDIQEVSWWLTKQVGKLIERCLQLHMNHKEVLETLLVHAKIEPSITEHVWRKLEAENQEFFKAYYLRLAVKQQIMEFNRLLGQQAQLMEKLPPAAVASLPTSKGSHIPASHQNQGCYAVEQAGAALTAENLQHSVGSSLPNVFTNGGPALHTSVHAAVETFTHANMIEAHLSAQGSSIGLVMPGTNSGMATSGPEGSPYMFGAAGNILEARQTIGDASLTSFASVDINSRSLSESLLDHDTLFGFLGQIPRNFSLSDLMADFSKSSENKSLDTISKGLGYEDFGSE